jgi:murein DD-endopeptidase MepM/ murein hydrolase activator NlpD
MTARGGVPGRLVRAIGIRRRGITAVALLLAAYTGPAHAEPRQAGVTQTQTPAAAVSSILGSASRGLLVRVDRPLARPAGLAALDASAPRFPIRGRHWYGDFGASFGGGRGHQGQDVFAACGTPLVAVRGGRVQVRDYHGRAGNYLIIDGAGTPFDYVYAHLREPARVAVGRRVVTGQLIGLVGRTGDATACHLHFEIWSGPGWYSGGAPFDPLPRLRAWDRVG